MTFSLKFATCVALFNFHLRFAGNYFKTSAILAVGEKLHAHYTVIFLHKTLVALAHEEIVTVHLVYARYANITF